MAAAEGGGGLGGLEAGVQLNAASCRLHRGKTFLKDFSIMTL